LFMVNEINATPAHQLQAEIEWAISVINARFNSYFSDEATPFSVDMIYPPKHHEPTVLKTFIDDFQWTPAERIVIALAIIPHVQPNILDVFFTKNNSYDRGYTEFWGIKGQYFSGFLPTGETALFVLAANDLAMRQDFLYMFSEDHPFAKNQVLWLDNPHASEPFLSGMITLSDEYIDLLVSGKKSRPKYNVEFPAKRIETALEWTDLVLEGATLEQVDEILTWVKYGDALLKEWHLDKKIKGGYKCLFYGPSGTGKTLTATLIGKHTQKDVYRIDLSMIVSKFIGETEKNLSKVFEKAATKDWILFFDEADALFGKRTSVGDSHDRYANQEVSFLLQKLEDHEGLVILATNLKSNIDEAFTRRFQSVIHFPMPKARERALLWQKTFSTKSTLHENVDLQDVAETYELSGGAITNVVRYASLMALKNETDIIDVNWILRGVKKEFLKEGKTL
jgi:hypothetical protein